jgi:hypothetical protein
MPGFILCIRALKAGTSGLKIASRFSQPQRSASSRWMGIDRLPGFRRMEAHGSISHEAKIDRSEMSANALEDFAGGA